MRRNFSASWIFRGWITWALVILYAQNSFSKSLQCEETQYVRGSKCCNKCKPGSRVLSHCKNSQQTTCVSCNHGEYQPGWTQETSCHLQRVCDTGKGFMERPENFVTEEPCRCRRGLQCHPINCEFCEKIPTCSPGLGLEVDHGSTSGRKICIPCKKGFFSADYNMEPCQQWTNCRAGGRNETQPGSAQADAVCGLPAPGTTPSWAIVSVLLVITVLCLLILLLFCYKDKLKLLSVNLRSCVQNLKRTRIQQETLAPLYHSGAAGGPKCTPCEITKLMCQAPQGPENDPLCTFPTSGPYVRIPLPFTEEMTNKGGVKVRKVTEDRSEGLAQPEEVSEEEVVSVSPLLAGSCVCVIPVREPLEVGENEDCSQAVSPGTPASCSCGGLEGDRDGEENRKEDKSGGERAREGSNGSQENTASSMSEASVASLISLSSPLLHTASAISQSSSPPELCLALTQAQLRSQFKCDLTDRSLVKQEGLHRLPNTDSTCTENSLSPAMTSVSPLMTSMSVGNLHSDSPPEASTPERDQGISWGDSRENKFSLGESELECLPESLHSNLAEPSLTSGLVSGNHNTTFISSGQVMNFSGEVVVVYVSQTPHDSDEGRPDDAFRSPVQEESSETALFLQSSQRSQGDSVSQRTLQDETLPVQEVMEGQLSDK
ncbi:tumor necrosis factor receptor superfamily member 11A [Melanotaenia boesemani]|uniref:tumor necrosis factor receptor superfamily member 11A n=1 Tax=Melanotaenia boesemani TaxID=1250792 RepID=UPI001C044CF0|nr:tumor necrosis factor receptor superfamily member 11A [Melanotaenia boesemani]